MGTHRKHIIITFLFLLLATIAGVLLRFQLFDPISLIKYKFLLHSHSHVALIGWVYNALFIAIYYQFLQRSESYSKYSKLFWITQVTILGMFISFLFQGYALISITFSTLYLFASYVFVFLAFKDLKNQSGESDVPVLFIKSSLIYLVVSSMGPWALGIVIATGSSHTIWYNLSVYFYLHFLYNGFVVFALFGLLLKYLEINNDEKIRRKTYKIFLLMNIAVVPAYLLSTTYLKPSLIVYLIAGIAALLQLVALGYLFQIIFDRWKQVKSRISYPIRILLFMIFLSYILKVGMQLLSALPSLAEMAYGSRQYTVIGYLHLVMLGFITLSLLAWIFHHYVQGELHSLFKVGLVLLISGIIISESLLFGQGLSTYYFYKGIPDFSKYMFYSSALMPLGILLITLKIILFKPANKN